MPLRGTIVAGAQAERAERAGVRGATNQSSRAVHGMPACPQPPATQGGARMLNNANTEATRGMQNGRQAVDLVQQGSSNVRPARNSQEGSLQGQAQR